MKDFFERCGSSNMEEYASTKINELRSKIKDQKVICALSGGVDSTVCAVLLHKAVGKQLTCIFVDHGLMRKDEPAQVERMAQSLGMNFIHINARNEFYQKLENISDPEQKRKIIGETFIRVFEKESRNIGKVGFLVQGTIYPDVIESGSGDAALVKSHHNVGGLPDVVDFDEIIEPLRMLYKNEVRELGLALDIDEALVWRQPFPGPGLGVRILDPITPQRVKTLQEADAIFREEVAAAGLAQELGQYFAVLTNVKAVGVKNGVRTHDHVVALRAVHSGDFMTAEAAPLPHELLGRAAHRIVNEVPGVGRVVYDITAKPPGTIEWQ